MSHFSALHYFQDLIEDQSLAPIAQAYLAQHQQDMLALLDAKKIRLTHEQRFTYVVHGSSQSDGCGVAYVFLPFILANLNQPTVYHAVYTEQVQQLFKTYYQSHLGIDLNINTALLSLKLYLNFQEPDQQVHLLYQGLLAALKKPEVSRIILITDLDLNQDALSVLAKEYAVTIDLYIPQHLSFDSKVIENKQLFFKYKDEAHTLMCRRLAEINAPMITGSGLSLEQATCLIEDMFYAEHIYEKLSVYGEYIQTQLQERKRLAPAS